jgi:hypothetical protein
MSRTRTRKAPVGRAALATASDAFAGIRNEVEARPWWYTTLLVIGFVALLTAVAVLFFGINSAPSHVAPSEQPAEVESPCHGWSARRLNVEERFKS